VSAFLFVLRPARWQEWISFGIGTALVAIPELIWTISGTATETSKFFDWFFGWDKRGDEFVWFWIKNTGLTIPAIFMGLYLLWTQWKESTEGEDEEHEHSDAPQKKAKKPKNEERRHIIPNAKTLLYFYIPFAFIFVLTNVAKLAPWEWD